MRTLSLCFFPVLLTGTLLGQEIRVTTEVRCESPVSGETYAWFVVVEGQLRPFFQDPDGRAIKFPGGKPALVLLVVDGEKFQTTVGRQEPVTPPKPADEVAVPADPFGNVGRLSFRVATTSIRPNAEASRRVSATATLYRHAAGELLAGTKGYRSVQEAKQTLEDAQKELWGSTAAIWESEWVDKWANSYNEHVASGEATTVETVAAFYMALAIGLEHVK